MFEGIGGVMPIMHAAKDRETFLYLLPLAMGTLCVIYIIFAELNYYTFGETLTKPIIMEMMPSDNRIIQIVKMLFIVNLIFSYPLTIFVTNVILEDYTCNRIKKKSWVRTWLKNA